MPERQILQPAQPEENSLNKKPFRRMKTKEGHEIREAYHVGSQKTGHDIPV